MVVTTLYMLHVETGSVHNQHQLLAAATKNK